MYTPAPSEHELVASGMTAQDLEGEPIELWPENERAYFLFVDLRRQWRVGMGGATGLDHNVMFRRMDRMNLTPEEYDQLDADIMVMEDAALEAMAERE